MFVEAIRQLSARSAVEFNILQLMIRNQNVAFLATIIGYMLVNIAYQIHCAK